MYSLDSLCVAWGFEFRALRPGFRFRGLANLRVLQWFQSGCGVEVFWVLGFRVQGFQPLPILSRKVPSLEMLLFQELKQELYPRECPWKPRGQVDAFRGMLQEGKTKGRVFKN